MNKKTPGISNIDIQMVLELVNDRVTLGSNQPIDTAMLPLAAAEIAILQLQADWPYQEDALKTIKQMRKNARVIAARAIADLKKKS